MPADLTGDLTADPTAGVIRHQPTASDGPVGADVLGRLGTVLAVWARPDDETYLAGGLLAGLSDLGRRVVCVTATRGEAADPDATAGQRAALAAVRTRELAEALEVLGVTEHHWLDLPDGGCADVDPAVPVGCLVALVGRVRPDTVLTFGPDGFTGHPDHRAVSGWVELALARTTHQVNLFHAVLADDHLDRQPALVDDLGVYDLGRPRVCTDDELGIRLQMDHGRRASALLDRKVEALLRQQSQTAGLVDAIGLDGLRAWVAVEAYAPPG